MHARTQPLIVKTMLAFVLLICANSASAQSTYTVLHDFGPLGDGLFPYAGLVFDGRGNLYGTTILGGGEGCPPQDAGCGTVFELTPNPDGSWSETIIYAFQGQDDRGGPVAPVTFDRRGNLYGTTSGSVFKLTPHSDGMWEETTLHTFAGFDDGYSLDAGVVLDGAGNIYSTASRGGTYGFGVVFSLGDVSALNWHEFVLHAFAGGADGTGPRAPVILDTRGNLYGTTVVGGPSGAGTVFELMPNRLTGGWREDVLHDFSGGSDGSYPEAGLVFDALGNLYGTTYYGGPAGQGTVFELTPNPDGSWTESVLYAFSGGSDGAQPSGGLIFDDVGNLYGVTMAGGTGYLMRGTVYKLTPSFGGPWTKAILHSFGDYRGGIFPFGELVLDGAGNLYGTTSEGGTYGDGVVYKLTP